MVRFVTMASSRYRDSDRSPEWGWLPVLPCGIHRITIDFGWDDFPFLACWIDWITIDLQLNWHELTNCTWPVWPLKMRFFRHLHIIDGKMWWPVVAPSLPLTTSYRLGGHGFLMGWCTHITKIDVYLAVDSLDPQSQDKLVALESVLISLVSEALEWHVWCFGVANETLEIGPQAWKRCLWSCLCRSRI